MIAHPRIALHARRHAEDPPMQANRSPSLACVLPPAHRPTWLTTAGHILLLALAGALVILACLS